MRKPARVITREEAAEVVTYPGADPHEGIRKLIVPPDDKFKNDGRAVCYGLADEVPTAVGTFRSRYGGRRWPRPRRP